MREIENATSDHPDLVVMQFVPPFPKDAQAIVGSSGSISNLRERLTGLGWVEASADYEPELNTYLDERRAEHLNSLTPQEQNRGVSLMGAAVNDEGEL
jgi:hypothetical protein